MTGLEAALQDTRVLYTLLLALVGLERLVELVISRRHARAMLARGAVEVGADHYRWMVLVHATFLAACPLEVWLLDRPWIPALGITMLVVLGGTMALRYWVVLSLGEHWNTRVILLPGAPLVTRGPYRFMRHPNYVAVVLELLALPLVHTAWLTAIVYGVANALVLRTRIRVEDAALRAHAGPVDQGTE